MWMLAVGCWPSTPETCDRERSHLDDTSQALVASMNRRIGAADVQLRHIYIAPVIGFDGGPRRHRIVETEAAAPAVRIADVVPTRSSRGPPHS